MKARSVGIHQEASTTATAVLDSLFSSSVMRGHVEAQPTAPGRRSLDPTGKEILRYMKRLEWSEYRGKLRRTLSDCLRKLIKRGLISSFQFGREYSPVLYVEVNPSKRDWQDGLLTTNGQRRRTRAVFEALKAAGEPDEAMIVSEPVVGENGRMAHLGQVRLWWD